MVRIFGAFVGEPARFSVLVCEDHMKDPARADGTRAPGAALESHYRLFFWSLVPALTVFLATRTGGTLMGCSAPLHSERPRGPE